MQCKSNSFAQKNAARKGLDERLFVYCHSCSFQNEYSTSCKSNTKTKVLGSILNFLGVNWGQKWTKTINFGYVVPFQEII